MTTLVDKEFQNWLKENRSLPWAESDIVEMAFKAGWEARGMEVEREGQVQQQLTNKQLARLWNMQDRYSGWTFTVAAVYIKAVQETFAAGVTSEEGVCRVLRCRKNTKQWRGIAEIRARLLGEWTEPLKSTP